MKGWGRERGRKRETEKEGKGGRERESRLSMRGNASVDARIKVLFDTHAECHFRVLCTSIIIDIISRV